MLFSELQNSIILKVQDHMKYASISDGFIAEVTPNYYYDLLRTYPDFKPSQMLYINVVLNVDISTAYAYRDNIKIVSSVVKI